MGYPDTFEGFMINSHEKWSDFKKQEVSLAYNPLLRLKAYSILYSSSQSRSRTETLTSRSMLAECAVQTCTALLAAGERPHCLFVSDMRSLVKLLKLVIK